MQVVRANMTRNDGTCVRWTSVLLTLILSFLQRNVEADPTLVGRLCGVVENSVPPSHQEPLAPHVDIKLEPGCMQGATNSTYSVIVHTDNPRVSNLFQDHGRVCSYSRGVVSVQLTDPIWIEPWKWTPDYPPFLVGHPPEVTNRVRIFYTSHKTRHPGTREMSHLKAACEDPSEVTLIMFSDEVCVKQKILDDLPSSCFSNIARPYPFNPPRSDLEPRIPYIPLGPRDSLGFINASERAQPASERPVLFNVAVSLKTAPRRREVVRIAKAFREKHPTWKAFVNDKEMLPEEYRSLLLDSTLTLCPEGHNPQTFRLFECLEAGSIPIISRQDFLYPSHKAPFPCGEGEASWNTVAAAPFAKEVSVGSWEELPELLVRLKEAPAEYIDRLQADCVAWYEALMRRSYDSVLNFGRGYDLWPQHGPVVLEGFPERSEPYPETPPYKTWPNRTNADGGGV